MDNQRGHQLAVPWDAGRGLTEWVAVCSCGAEFRCYYSRYGLEWRTLNEACERCRFGSGGAGRERSADRG